MSKEKKESRMYLLLLLLVVFFFVILHDSIRFSLLFLSSLSLSFSFVYVVLMPFAPLGLSSRAFRLSFLVRSFFSSFSFFLAPHSHKGGRFSFPYVYPHPSFANAKCIDCMCTEEKHTHTKHIRRINSEYKEKHNRLIYKTHLLI